MSHSANAPATDSQLQHRLAEPFAFALLQWPTLLALLSIEEAGAGWWALRCALALVLALLLIGAYSGRRGLGFGNAMLACSGCVAAAWWTWPAAWSLAWLALLALLMLAAQGLRLRGIGREQRETAAIGGAS